MSGLGPVVGGTIHDRGQIVGRSVVCGCGESFPFTVSGSMEWESPALYAHRAEAHHQAARTLAVIERYCRMSRHSMTVPTAEFAEEILALIRGGEADS